MIIGESALKSNISRYVISSTKTLLKKINKLSGFNILHQCASNVGSLKLGLQTKNLNKVYFLHHGKNIYNKNYDIFIGEVKDINLKKKT